MRRRARKRDFRGGSISDFFNKIDVKPSSQEVAQHQSSLSSLSGSFSHRKQIGRRGDSAAVSVPGHSTTFVTAVTARRPARRPTCMSATFTVVGCVSWGVSVSDQVDPRTAKRRKEKTTPTPEEGVRLVKAFCKIENAALRNAIVKLIEELSRNCN
jgi:hypothetical protein